MSNLGDDVADSPRPAGKPIRRAAAERADAAALDGPDLKTAREAWHRYAPADRRGLIDARPDPETEDGGTESG